MLHSITLLQSRLFSVKNLSIALNISSHFVVVSSEMQASSSSMTELSFRNLPQIRSCSCDVISVDSREGCRGVGERGDSSVSCGSCKGA